MKWNTSSAISTEVLRKPAIAVFEHILVVQHAVCHQSDQKKLSIDVGCVHFNAKKYIFIYLHR